jgi:hypothetical protein
LPDILFRIISIFLIMKNRNTLLGLVVALLLAAGIVWWVRQAPVEKPVVESAPAKAAVQVAMPVIPHKAEVVAPTAPAVAPSANPSPAETPVAASNPDADLNTAVNDLINTLQSGDVNGFVQNYLAPSMMEMAKSQMEARAQNPNMTPEMKAQMQQVFEQRVPMEIQQFTQEMSQRPDALQGLQKMAAALAQATPPQMNDAGDRATYNLQTNGDKDVPSSVVLERLNGKWTLDYASLMRSMAPVGPRGN